MEHGYDQTAVVRGLFTDSPRYAIFLTRTMLLLSCEDSRARVYATDPMYADELMCIISGNTLRSARTSRRMIHCGQIATRFYEQPCFRASPIAENALRSALASFSKISRSCAPNAPKHWISSARASSTA